MSLSQARQTVGTVTRLPVIGWIINLRVLSLVLLVIGWWYTSGFYKDYFLPGPDTVLKAIWEIAVSSDELWVALSISLQSLVIGVLLALSVGITLGVLMGSQRVIENIFDMYVNALYVAPISALTPLLVVAFGIGLESRVAVVFFFSAPEVIITCYQGARDTPRIFVEVARAFGATNQDIFSKVIVPHEIPYIVTAMRLGLGRAIKGMVLAEMWILSTGLGEKIDYYYSNWKTAYLMAYILALMLLGVLATMVIRRIEIAIASWREA